MNFYTEIRHYIFEIIHSLQNASVFPSDLVLDSITTEPPKNPEHGEISTNVAMVLAKQLKSNPRQIAEILLPHIQTLPHLQMCEIAGAGFINIRLKPSFWHQKLKEILEAGNSFGCATIGSGKNMNVEYVSVNPTGPMHAGHGRVAIVGDAIAALMKKAGYSVTKEYYINDGGGQAITLAKSTYLRYLEALGEDIGEIPAGMYPGDYLIPVGKALAEKYGTSLKNQKEEEWLPEVQLFAINAMMDLIRSDLALVGIHQDVFTAESSIIEAGMVEKSIQDLKDKGFVYEGVLDVPKGIEVDDWAPEPQLLFKSTAFGDDVDRVLQRSNGEYTYFAKDMAYHLDKLQRGFDHQVNIWGADHAGYIKRIVSAVRALSDNKVDLKVLTCQMVNFMQDGEALKMSKRSGTFITLRDVINAVGKDVVRFVMLMRRNDAMLDFDYERVLEQSKDNPVFYVQYAYARIHSVLRQAEKEFGDISLSDLSSARMDLLQAPSEIEVMRYLAGWPRCIESAAYHVEPHRIGSYLYELAGHFHALWNQGKSDVALRFVSKDKDETYAKLALLKAVAFVIASGLEIFGVTPVEEMR